MKRFKSSKKNNSSKTKYTIRKDNVIFEDTHTHVNHTTKFKLIFDSKEPTYKYEYKEKK